MLHLCHQSAIFTIYWTSYIGSSDMHYVPPWLLASRAIVSIMGSRGAVAEASSGSHIPTFHFMDFSQGVGDYFHCNFFLTSSVGLSLSLRTNPDCMRAGDQRLAAFLCILLRFSLMIMCLQALASAKSSAQHSSSKVALPHKWPQGEILE